MPPERSENLSAAGPGPTRPARRTWDSTVLGGLLILVGAVFLLGRLVSFDLGHYGWPLFVIAPGVLILLFASAGRGVVSEGLAITGSIVTITGLILLYQNAADRFESWAYAWPLIVPGAVGVGMIIYGMRAGRRGNVRAGVRLIAIAGILFLVGAVFFELVLGIGGLALGPGAGAVLSVLIIAAGLLLLVSNLRLGARRHSR